MKNFFEYLFYILLGSACVYISIQSVKLHPQKVKEYLQSKGYSEVQTTPVRGLFTQGFCKNDRVNFVALKDNKRQSGYVCANSWFKVIH